MERHILWSYLTDHNNGKIKRTVTIPRRSVFGCNNPVLNYALVAANLLKLLT